jgi:hypothetical protein
MKRLRPVSSQSDVPSQRSRIHRPNLPGVQPDIAQFHPARAAISAADQKRLTAAHDAVTAGRDAFRPSGLGDDLTAPAAPYFHTLPNKLRMVNFTINIPNQTLAGGIILINANPMRRRFIIQMDNAQPGSFYWTYGSTTIGSGIAVPYWDENGSGVSTDDIYIYNVTGSDQLCTAYEGVDHDNNVPQ